MTDAVLLQQKKAKDIEAYVTHCSDGDTCRVQFGDSLWVNVRLAGIDAPEVSHSKKRPGQPLGEEAKVFLNALVQGKAVQVRQSDLDPFNRPVVELVQGAISVNLRMVQEGFAEAYRGKAKRLDRAPYLGAEAAAKAAKKGIWGLPVHVSPAHFRLSAKRVHAPRR